MPNTFELIASSTVGAGGAASIDFTSIPSTYTDLSIATSLRNASTFGTVYVTFNSNTSSYSGRRLFVNLSSVSSDTVGRDMSVENPASFTASTFSNGNIYIPNYAGSTNKSVSLDWVTENNATNNYLGFVAALWSNSAAITSVSLAPAAGTFAQYSTAYLYGVKNA